MRSGFGPVTFDGLVQIRYLSDFPGLFHTFRVRRTELKLSGAIRPKLRWTVMIDPAKLLAPSITFENVTLEAPPIVSVGVNQATRILQDAYLTFDLAAPIKFDLGQRKVPLSLEGLQSSASLKTVERALFLSDRARGGYLGDVRDIGVLAYCTASARFEYFLGASKGIGDSQNTVDENSGKALSGRLTLQSEVMGGQDNGIHRLGTYILAAFKATPILEPVLQFDWFDPDRQRNDTAATVSERDFLAGLNIYVDGDHMKFQINYIRKTFSAVLGPFNTWLLNGQMSW
jgi:hypothetical protein